MKKRLTKLISSVLILAFLVSAFSVLAFANESDADNGGVATASDSGMELIVNRPYDEGWSYDNGFGTDEIGDHKFSIDYEEDENYNYNYFCRIESADVTTGYLKLGYGTNSPELTHTVFEIDIKTDDLCNFGSPIIYLVSNDNMSGERDKKVHEKYAIAGITDNNLVLTPSGEITPSTAVSYSVGNLGEGEWLHFAMSARVDQRQCPMCNTIYDLTLENKFSLYCTCEQEKNENAGPVLVGDMLKLMTARIYFSYSDQFNPTAAVKAPGRADRIDLSSNTYYYDVVFKDIASIESIFIGMPKNNKTIGHSYKIDNVKLYNGVSVPTGVPAYLGYGTNVDVTQAKTEEIIGSDNGKTILQYISEGLIMKTDFEYCIDAGTRRPILADGDKAYGAPIKIDGEVYVPLQAILDWIGYPPYQHEDGLSFDISTDKGSTFIAIGRSTATVNGELVELDAAPGIATDPVTEKPYVVISKNDVEKLFDGYHVTYDEMGLIAISEGADLFNRESDLKLMLDVMKSFVFTNLSAQQYFDYAKENTSNFSHPYIIADQDEFNALREAYLETEDEALKKYLEKVIADAADVFDNYTASVIIESPDSDKESFKLVLFQNQLGKTLYFTGEIEGFDSSLKTSEKCSEAADVYVENVYDADETTVLGYKLYFYKNDAKYYIRLYENRPGDPGLGGARVEITTKIPLEYYTYNLLLKTFVVTSPDGFNSYYIGASNRNQNLSYGNMATITEDNLGNLDTTRFPLRLVSLVTDNDELFGAEDTSGAPSRNSSYEYLFDTIKNPYATIGNNGYDGGGRHPMLVECTEDIKLLAFAYQITGEEKYAVLAYEMVESLMLWTHWAPAYFIDCAEATANVAIAYDWLYNVWTAMGYNVKDVESIIYRNGVLIGYNFTNGVELNESILSNQGISTIYNTSTGKWNAMGTSYMAIASLALLGTDYLNNGNVYKENTVVEEGTVTSTEFGYVNAALNLLVNNVYGLTQIGLDVYAPDGSFIESATAWSETTEAVMLLSWALTNAIGDDIGIANTWALDKTFYYAYQVEYKVTDGFKYWNYHEASGDKIDTDLAYYAATALGDTTIAAIRTEQIDFKGVSIWDVLAYKPEFITAELNKTGSNFTLDYTLTSCEGIISRSDWSDTALYVGIMGNANNAPGGQVDSGNFVYANKGTMWFVDLGAETHTVYGYSDVTYRYGYYRHSGEGANTIILTSKAYEQTIPYGQALNAGGKIKDYYTDENGMYVIIDNSAVYLDKVASAERGMLLTNDRKTVVVQDEVVFKNTEECAWVSQVISKEGKIRLSSDGRMAFITQDINGVTQTLRITLIDATGALKFTIQDAYETMLSTIYPRDASQKSGEMYTHEIDRGGASTGLKKLVVAQELASSFKIAVVLEMTSLESTPVEYDYKDLAKWSPDMITEEYMPEEIGKDVFTTPSLDDVEKYATEASGYINSGDAFNLFALEDFYRSISRIYNCEFWLGETEISGAPSQAIKEAYRSYLDYKERYDTFKKLVNNYVNDNKKIAANICGYEK